jgi:uncharacterized protein (DUF362 family)
MDIKKPIPVALARCESYDLPLLQEKIDSLLEAAGCSPKPGSRVLVKPNFLAPVPPDNLPCTNPEVIGAVCRYLVRSGARVKVGDSPTFGKAVDVAKQIGFTDCLSDLPVEIINFSQPKIIRLSSGGWTAISRFALESDLILNLPKLKAHHQMRVTGAVKNIYGCVTGPFKPWFHLLYGDRNGRFRKMIFEIWNHLPPTISLMDAVIAMHIQGPVKGKPCPLGIVAASVSPFALDSALMNIIGVQPEEAPLWRLARTLKLPGAELEDIVYPLQPPDAFHSNGFRTPDHLFPVSFRPLKVATHLYKKFMKNHTP